MDMEAVLKTEELTQPISLIGRGAHINGDPSGSARVIDNSIKRLNVKDFDAIGDGVSDDRAAIMNAISSASCLPGNSEVFFPEGTYYIGGGRGSMKNPVRLMVDSFINQIPRIKQPLKLTLSHCSEDPYKPKFNPKVSHFNPVRIQDNT
jgi:hypothetical protein